MTSLYDEIPGIAGSVLRAAEHAGLSIRDGGTDNYGVHGWTITDPRGYDSLDALYVYWTPSSRTRGRSGIYRQGRRKSASIVKTDRGYAFAWIRTRQVEG